MKNGNDDLSIRGGGLLGGLFKWLIGQLRSCADKNNPLVLFKWDKIECVKGENFVQPGDPLWTGNPLHCNYIVGHT